MVIWLYGYSVKWLNGYMVTVLNGYSVKWLNCSLFLVSGFELYFPTVDCLLLTAYSIRLIRLPAFLILTHNLKITTEGANSV